MQITIDRVISDATKQKEYNQEPVTGGPIRWQGKFP